MPLLAGRAAIAPLAGRAAILLQAGRAAMPVLVGRAQIALVAAQPLDDGHELAHVRLVDREI